MNFNEQLFRCSSLGYIMTEPQKKSEKLSETCKAHLIDLYVAAKYGRQTDLANKYMEKGLMVEEDSITLYSRVKRVYYRKNTERLSNGYIIGTPDLFAGLEIQAADVIIDVKSSWDIYTFFRTLTRDIDKHYYWQLQGYMALTGARLARLAYCLINTPEQLIADEKRRLMWKMGIGTEENKLYEEACEKLDKLMRYDDIPLNERLIEFDIERKDEDIARIEQRVRDCRDYMNAFEEKRIVLLNPMANGVS